MLIYLAGGMSGLSFDEQVEWRNKIKREVMWKCSDLRHKPQFFSPPEYYSYEVQFHKTEREVMEYELGMLRKSDLVIVNFNSPNSIGTAMEIAAARENRIPIVGINKGEKELHPWLVESTMRMCNDLKECIEYVIEYYLS